MSEAVFTPDGEGFRATELARGPWDPGALHGGAPAALLAQVFDRLPAPEGLITARLTLEIMRPVPVERLTVSAEIIRPGRRVQLLEGSVFGPDGTEVVRARALRVRRIGAGVEVPPPDIPAEPAPPGPEHGLEMEGRPAPYVLFAPDAMEVRFVAGQFMTLGPATAWFRLRQPVIAGVELTPLARVAAAADFPNGISAILPWDRHSFINPDLTIYLEREAHGEWIGLQASSRVSADGIGLAEAVLYDERGRIGRATQSLVIDRR